MLAPNSLHRARHVLLSIWLACGFSLFLLLVYQVFAGNEMVRSDEVELVFSWFLPCVSPTLLMMVGIIVADQRNRTIGMPIDERWFRISILVSLAYFVVLFLVPIRLAFDSKSVETVIKQSGLWQSSFQAIVTGVLAAFFVREPREAA